MLQSGELKSSNIKKSIVSLTEASQTNVKLKNLEKKEPFLRRSCATSSTTETFLREGKVLDVDCSAPSI